MARKAQPFKAVWEDHILPDHDGHPVHLRGYSLTNANTGAFVGDHPYEFAHLHVHCLHVAGVSYHADELQRHEFAPGHAIALRLEPENPHDGNAVGVWDLAGVRQVGYIPRKDSAEVAQELRAGGDITGVVLRETRDDDEDRRIGLTILFGPRDAGKVPWSELILAPEHSEAIRVSDDGTFESIYGNGSIIGTTARIDQTGKKGLFRDTRETFLKIEGPQVAISVKLASNDDAVVSEARKFAARINQLCQQLTPPVVARQP